MHGRWMIHEQRDALLIFFNGWGMDEKPFLPLVSQRLDVYMLCDYRDLSLPESLVALAAPYSEVHVLAWSLGVWAAWKNQAEWPAAPASITALNGTLQPINSRFGIPPVIFDATLAQLSPETLTAFYHNMFPSETTAMEFMQLAPVRPWEKIRDELAQLRAAILAEPGFAGGKATPQPFGRVLIGMQDRIIPAAAQRRFWQGHPACRRLEIGHFPFYAEPQWDAWVNYEPA
jgi:hypothetical protein